MLAVITGSAGVAAADERDACRSVPAPGCLIEWAEGLAGPLDPADDPVQTWAMIARAWIDAGATERALDAVRTLAAQESGRRTALIVLDALYQRMSRSGEHKRILATLDEYDAFARDVGEASFQRKAVTHRAHAMIRTGDLDMGLALVRNMTDPGRFDLGGARSAFVIEAVRHGRIDDAVKTYAKIDHDYTARQTRTSSLLHLWVAEGSDAATSFATKIGMDKTTRTDIFEAVVNIRAGWDPVSDGQIKLLRAGFAAEEDLALAIQDPRERIRAVYSLVRAYLKEVRYDGSGGSPDARALALYEKVQGQADAMDYLKSRARDSGIAPPYLVGIGSALISEHLVQGRAEEAFDLIDMAPDYLLGFSLSSAIYFASRTNDKDLGAKILARYGARLKTNELAIDAYDEMKSFMTFVELLALSGDADAAFGHLGQVMQQDNFSARTTRDSVLARIVEAGRLDLAKKMLASSAGNTRVDIANVVISVLCREGLSDACRAFVEAEIAAGTHRLEPYSARTMAEAALRNGAPAEVAFRLFDSIDGAALRARFLAGMARNLPATP